MDKNEENKLNIKENEEVKEVKEVKEENEEVENEVEEEQSDEEEEERLQNNEELGISEMESLCMSCMENGKTRMMIHKIPYFRELIIASFECPHCGERNNEVTFGGEIQIQGCRYELLCTNENDLNRQLIKSDSASVVFPVLEFEIPPKTQKGEISTIEGFISTAARNLSLYQRERMEQDPVVGMKVADIIRGLQRMVMGEAFPFVLIVNDPAGNSFVENLFAPKPDPNMKVSHFNRTPEEDMALGLQPEHGTYRKDTDTNLVSLIDGSSKFGLGKQDTDTTTNTTTTNSTDSTSFPIPPTPQSEDNNNNNNNNNNITLTSIREKKHHSILPPPPPPTPQNRKSDNSSDYSDDYSGGDPNLPTTSQSKSQYFVDEDPAHTHSATEISLDKEIAKPALHSKSSRNLLLPPPTEISNISSVQSKILPRSLSRAQSRNQLSRQQSSAAAAAEAQVNPYKGNVGSAGFRMSNKSFKVKKMDSTVENAHEESDDDDFFSETKQKKFDRSENTSVISSLTEITEKSNTSNYSHTQHLKSRNISNNINRSKKGAMVVSKGGTEFMSTPMSSSSSIATARSNKISTRKDNKINSNM